MTKQIANIQHQEATLDKGAELVRRLEALIAELHCVIRIIIQHSSVYQCCLVVNRYVLEARILSAAALNPNTRNTGSIQPKPS